MHLNNTHCPDFDYDQEPTAYTDFTLREMPLIMTPEQQDEVEHTFSCVRSLHNFYVQHYKAHSDEYLKTTAIGYRQVKEDLIDNVEKYPADLGFILDMEKGILETHIRIIVKTLKDFREGKRHRPAFKSSIGAQYFWNAKSSSLQINDERLVLTGRVRMELPLTPYHRKDKPTVYRVIRDKSGKYWMACVYEDIVPTLNEEYDNILKAWSTTLQSMKKTYRKSTNLYDRRPVPTDDPRAYSIRKSALSRLLKQKYVKKLQQEAIDAAVEEFKVSFEAEEAEHFLEINQAPVSQQTLVFHRPEETFSISA